MSKFQSGWTLSSSDEDDESLLTDKYCSPAVVKEKISHAHNSSLLNKEVSARKSNSKLVKKSSSGTVRSFRKNSADEKSEIFPKPDKRKNFESSDESIPKKKKLQLDIHSMNKRFDPKFIWELSAPHYFLLSTVTGISAKSNHIARQDKHTLMAPNSLGIKDLLSSSFGSIAKSAQFNYCIDVDWMMKQYPECSKDKPLLLVHGEQRGNNLRLVNDCKSYPNISLCQADLPPYGTHHTKMMLLLYETGLRVIILTANLVSQDWMKKTQGMWVSPVFPKIIDDCSKSDKSSRFKHDLVLYLKSYKKKQLNSWIEIIEEHDLSSSNVILIASVPGKSRT